MRSCPSMAQLVVALSVLASAAACGRVVIGPPSLVADGSGLDEDGSTLELRSDSTILDAPDAASPTDALAPADATATLDAESLDADAEPEAVSGDASEVTPSADVDAGSEVEGPDAGCSSDDQCAAAAGPLADCQVAYCVAGQCVAGEAPSGTPCGAATKCLTVQGIPVLEARVCQAGACTAAVQKVSCQDGVPCTTDTCDKALGCIHAGADAACEDGNPCTQDACLAATGCKHGPVKGTCDDGDPCTEGDTCSGGQCLGGAAACTCAKDADCKAKSPCMPTTCQKGICVAAPAPGQPCSDGNECTVDDVCTAAGTCGGEPTTCDDGGGCTLDACSPLDGCTYQPDPIACDDGDPCTKDSCDSTGSCSHAPANGPCDDGNGCTVGDTCKLGKCQGGAQEPCPAAPACQQASCDPTTGTCANLPVPDGDVCDDANACSLDDTCQAGLCVGANNPCDDGNACTADLCGPDGSCKHEAQTVACNADNSLCSDGDSCVAGVCKAGPVKVCDDKNPCTIDGCDAQKGCHAEAVPPGTPCGSALWCLAGQCKPVVVPPGMVYVVAGTFTMGCNPKVDTQCNADEKPAHEVAVGSFLIDKTEVTAAQYGNCVDSGACAVPGKGIDATFAVAGKEAYPVNYVTHAQAKAYCTWAGGARLCSEAEWEYAARGKDGRLYPWGNAVPNCDLAHFSGCKGGLEPATANPNGQSPFGALNMAGNVREWVADWYGAAWYGQLAPKGLATDPSGPTTGTSRVMRGGYHLENAPELRTSKRAFATPATSAFSLGIRCCRSPK